MSLKVFHIVFVIFAGVFLALFAGWSFFLASGLERSLAVILGIGSSVGVLVLIFTERHVIASLPRRDL